MNKKPYLLAVVGVLVLLRFVFVPWYEHQQSDIDTLASLTRNLQSAMLAERSIAPLSEVLTLTQTKVSRLKAGLPVAKSVEQLSLTLQSELSAAAVANSVELELFDWRNHLLKSEPDIFTGRIAIRVSGNMANVARFFAQLENNAGFDINTMRLSGSRSRTQLPEVNVNAELVMLFVMGNS